MGAPGGDVEGGGVFGEFPVGVAFGPEGVGRDAEVEEGAESFEVGGSGEAGEEGASYL